MEKLWYKKLDKQIKTDLDMYKNIKINHNDYNKLSKSDKHFKITIIDNKIQTTIDEFSKDKYKFYKKEKINQELFDVYKKRIETLLKLLELTIDYSMKKKLSKITGTYFFRFNDNYDYKYNYPIFSYSKPKNKLGLLYPDFNFMDIFSKIKMFKKECNKKKINKIYFKGSNSTLIFTDIRYKMSLFKNPFKIIINDKYIPYYKICNYKYVLDIPGYRPWSVRLIELYMSKSLPIRILLYNSQINWNEELWIQFYENMFLKNESYIGLEYDIDYEKKISNKNINHIKSQSLLIYDFFNKHSKLYNKITTDNFKKCEALKKEHIYYYMYNILMGYNSILE